MEDKLIIDRPLSSWIQSYPIIEEIIHYRPVFWQNQNVQKLNEVKSTLPLRWKDMMEAKDRWERFAPLLMRLFPETKASQGIIESELVKIDQMKKALEEQYGQVIQGNLFLKKDSHLPVAGSIKARGGFYEVLKHAESLAMAHGLLDVDQNYSILATEPLRNFFSQYTISVGSTGNLGLSIGMMGRALGFQVIIHMSADAKEWKKELLREKGAEVIEYTSDYSKAVEEGRKQAEADPKNYFIDDEQSQDLFLGYSVAAFRLKKQLETEHLTVNQDTPLYVYIPCGVGGAPGGICFGLKMLFGDDVTCVFAEPTHSPSMLLGLLTKKHHQAHIADFGLDNRTEADGLAVGSPSKLVGELMEKLLYGIYTIEDQALFRLLALLKKSEGIKIEPSAAAGFLGPFHLLQREQITHHAIHVIWATGGALVPPKTMKHFYKLGESLII